LSSEKNGALRYLGELNLIQTASSKKHLASFVSLAHLAALKYTMNGQGKTFKA
jgi:hypothetical protein